VYIHSGEYADMSMSCECQDDLVEGLRLHN
jgi:hypothetical protein